MSVPGYEDHQRVLRLLREAEAEVERLRGLYAEEKALYEKTWPLLVDERAEVERLRAQELRINALADRAAESEQEVARLTQRVRDLEGAHALGTALIGNLRAEVARLSELGRRQWGCDGVHRGIGTPACPFEPHHHHDDRCIPGLTRQAERLTQMMQRIAEDVLPEPVRYDDLTPEMVRDGFIKAWNERGVEVEDWKRKYREADHEEYWKLRAEVERLLTMTKSEQARADAMARALEAVLDADQRERDEGGRWIGGGPGGYYRDAIRDVRVALAAFRTMPRGDKA